MQNCIKMLVVGLLIALPCVISAKGNPGEAEPLQLVIKADKDVYAPNEAIHIEFRIINVKETNLGPGKRHLTTEDDPSYVLIPKKIYIALVAEKGYFELAGGSIALDDETMKKVLTGKLEPLKKEDFIAIPPGYFYGRRFDISSGLNIPVRGELRGSYRNIYPGENAGVKVWTGTIQSNILDIKGEDKQK